MAGDSSLKSKAPRVFVSHHSSKHDVAEQVESLLAQRGIRCWIAPRDVPPGTPFDTAIQEAIGECSALLLLFCANSDKSRHVKRELILGDSAGRPIIPMRLEAIDPAELAYHLADSQWIDWIDGREAVMDRVASQVRLFAGQPAGTAAAATPAAAPVPASAPPPTSNAEERDEGEDRRKWAIPMLGGALALALAAVAYLALDQGEDAQPEDAVAGAVGAEPADGEGAASGDDAQTGEIDPAPTPGQPPSSAAPTGLVAVPLPTPTPTPTTRPTGLIAVPIATATPMQIRRTVQPCAGAASDAEYLICADPDFDARARRMGELLSELRVAVQDNGRSLSSFNTQQRAWFNSVKAQCSTADCVESRQEARLEELAAMLARFQ